MFKVLPLPRTLEAAQRDLRSEHARVRLEAVEDLGRQREAPGVHERAALLRGALSDADPSVRSRAAVALADIGAEGAVADLLSSLADPELSVRQMVVLALGELASAKDEEVIGRLTGLLVAGAPQIRFQALSAMARLIGKRARPEILQALRDEDPEIRQLGIRLTDEVLLSSDGSDDHGGVDQELADVLVGACTDRAEMVSSVAQLVCGEFRIEAPRDLIPRLVSGAIRAREPRDEQLAIELCGELVLREAEPALRRRAFGRWGLSFDPFTWPALTALALWGDPRAVRKIERSLRSGSYLRRNLAVKAAGDAHLAHLKGSLEGLEKGACDAEILAQALGRLREG